MIKNNIMKTITIEFITTTYKCKILLLVVIPSPIAGWLST